MHQNNDGPIHSLNVTPFIDVMLVLLVIFMLASSAIVADIYVNLPEANSSQERTVSGGEVMNVHITSTGAVLMQSQLVADADFARIAAKFRGRGEQLAVVINADTGVPYGKVISVMDTLRQNGITRVSLATKAGKSS
jgi:biopolymer transport protein ExbD